MAPKRKRFQLLVYRRYHQVHSGLSKFLIGFGLLLLIGAIAIKVFWSSEVGADALETMLLGSGAILVLGVLRFLFTFLVSKTAYVECKKVLRIRTPFLPLDISYKRIRNTRPSTLRDIFPPEKQKRNRKLLETYWGETVVMIELTKLPMPPGFLKAIMGPYLFDPAGNGLVLLVDDWMGFSQSLDQALTDYRAQRVSPVAQRGMYRPPR